MCTSCDVDYPCDAPARSVPLRRVEHTVPSVEAQPNLARGVSVANQAGAQADGQGQRPARDSPGGAGDGTEGNKGGIHHSPVCSL